MSAMDHNSKFPSSSSSINVSSGTTETHSTIKGTTPHLLHFGPQKRARDEGFLVEHAVNQDIMFPTSHLVYQPQYSYASPTKTNVNAMNRCYTFDNWDTSSSSSRMHNMYDTSIGGSEEVNDQALISMLNTIDWSSHSRSPDHTTANTAPAIVPECGRCSPLNPNMASSRNDEVVELRKPIPTTHINTVVPSGLHRSDEINTERNSSISSDDASILVATTTDEDISTSTSCDSKFSMSFNTSPSEKGAGGGQVSNPLPLPLSSQPSSSVQEGHHQTFLKFSMFRGYSHISDANNHNIQGFLATPKMHEHVSSPHVFDPRFRNVVMQNHQSGAAGFMNGNVRSVSRSSSDSFDTHPEDNYYVASSSAMKNTFYSPVVGCNQMEILRSVSSTDELNQRMPSLSILPGQYQVEASSKPSSSVKRRGRPRKVPITPARSTSTFTSFNSNSKAVPASSSGKSSNAFSKDAPSSSPMQAPAFPSLAYGSCTTNRISPIPELSPTAADQNDYANESSNSSPSLNELLVGGGGLSSGSGSGSCGDLRSAIPSPFSAAAATLDIRVPHHSLVTDSSSSNKIVDTDYAHYHSHSHSHSHSVLSIQEMNVSVQDLITNPCCKMEEDMFIGSEVFEDFDASLPLNYKF